MSPVVISLKIICFTEAKRCSMTAIDKDTILYASFAKAAGSRGCAFHNAGFKKHNINAIYKSFSINSIKDAVAAMKTLNIKGAGVTMPFKIQVLEHLDVHKDGVAEIMACNTLVNKKLF